MLTTPGGRPAVRTSFAARFPGFTEPSVTENRGTAGGTAGGTTSRIKRSVRAEWPHPGNGVGSMTLEVVPGAIGRGETGHAGMRTRCRCVLIGSPSGAAWGQRRG